jgi:hypothetical protein
LLSNGGLLAAGAPGVVLTAENLHALYLGSAHDAALGPQLEVA